MATNTTKSLASNELSEADLKSAEQKLAEQFKGEKQVDLMIPKALGTQDPLPIGINGVFVVIPVGQKVKVPQTIYDFVMEQTDIFNG